MFEECRSQCDKLIVGLQVDPTIDRPDKNKPIQSWEERKGMLHAIKYIDEVYLYWTEAELVEMLSTLKPDIRFIGADWEGKPYTGHELPIKVIFNSRNHNYSSSELRKRVWASENEIQREPDAG